jgi:hypothetical protein
LFSIEQPMGTNTVPTPEALREAGHMRRQADVYRSLGMHDIADDLMRRAARIDGGPVLAAAERPADPRIERLRASHAAHLARVARKTGAAA